MNPRVLAWVMAGAVAVYLVLLGQTALRLIGTGDVAGIGLGLAVLVFPFVGAWVVWREMRFGYVLQRMAQRYEATDADPERLEFEAARDRARSEPDNWLAWFELGLAYDGAGDRRRAREAMRQAATLYPQP